MQKNRKFMLILALFGLLSFACKPKKFKRIEIPPERPPERPPVAQSCETTKKCEEESLPPLKESGYLEEVPSKAPDDGGSSFDWSGVTDIFKDIFSGNTPPNKGGQAVETEPASGEKITSPPRPAVNACDKSSNKRINVQGYSFPQTAVAYEFYATISSIGIYGNFAGMIAGRPQSLLNSFGSHVRDGRIHPSGAKSMANAVVQVNGQDVKFARISRGNYPFNRGNYQVKYDLRAWGACIAVYGRYSGGNPILVMP